MGEAVDGLSLEPDSAGHQSVQAASGRQLMEASDEAVLGSLASQAVEVLPTAWLQTATSSWATRSCVSSVSFHAPTRPLKLPPAPRHMLPSSTWIVRLSTSASRSR